MRDRAARIRDVCESHGVPPGAAALQFVLAHPAVASVIPGPSSPEQVRRNFEWVNQAIPDEVWRSLKSEALLNADAPVPAWREPTDHELLRSPGEGNAD